MKASSDSKPLECPVDHVSTGVDHPFRLNHPSSSASSSTTTSSTAPATVSTLQHDAINPLNNMPPPNQRPAPNQALRLETERETSTIPMGGAQSGSNWIYPSEQMFFNAMRRKNWDAKEDDMKVIVPIHNAVNERCWKQILEWEALHQSTCAQPKLLKFIGRPKDYTPKARFRQLLGYKLPFDRHDWTVDRCGTKVTYVVDFYTGASGNPTDLAFYLDVRPEMSYQGVLDRLTKFWKTGTGLW